MANVNFNHSPSRKKDIYFNDLKENESFVIVNGRGAVYRKTRIKGDLTYFMMEEATGILFPATQSPIELIDVDVIIKTKKPAIYA